MPRGRVVVTKPKLGNKLETAFPVFKFSFLSWKNHEKLDEMEIIGITRHFPSDTNCAAFFSLPIYRLNMAFFRQDN